MKKVTLILFFVFISFLVQSQEVEYMSISRDGTKIVYYENGELIKVKCGIAVSDYILAHDGIVNDLAKKGWRVINATLTSTILERELPPTSSDK